MYEATLANVQSVRPHLGHISENGWPNTDVRDVTGTPFVPEHHRVSVVVEEDQIGLPGVVGPVNAVRGEGHPGTLAGFVLPRAGGSRNVERLVSFPRILFSGILEDARPPDAAPQEVVVPGWLFSAEGRAVVMGSTKEPDSAP